MGKFNTLFRWSAIPKGAHSAAKETPQERKDLRPTNRTPERTSRSMPEQGRGGSSDRNFAAVADLGTDPQRVERPDWENKNSADADPNNSRRMNRPSSRLIPRSINERTSLPGTRQPLPENKNSTATDQQNSRMPNRPSSGSVPRTLPQRQPLSEIREPQQDNKNSPVATRQNPRPPDPFSSSSPRSVNQRRPFSGPEQPLLEKRHSISDLYQQNSSLQDRFSSRPVPRTINDKQQFSQTGQPLWENKNPTGTSGQQNSRNAGTPSSGQRPPGGPKRRGSPVNQDVTGLFGHRKKDIGSWIYEHQVGLCSMVIAYLAFGIIFVTAKIVINEQTVYNTIYVEMAQAEQTPEQMQQQQDRTKGEDFSDFKNRISDETGRDESVDRSSSESSEGSSSSANSKEMNDLVDDLNGQAAAVAGRLQASRDAYEKGRREEREMVERHKKAQREAKEGEKASGVKQKGNVLVSYYLPGRRDVALVVPAYLCEGGGEVTVRIVVDQNGFITNASVKESSSSNTCLNEAAQQAAQQSRFNVDGKASNRQEGTITYVFVPQ